MRGWDARSDALFSYVSCEARVPKGHPLRPIRQIVDYYRFGRIGRAVFKKDNILLCLSIRRVCIIDIQNYGRFDASIFHIILWYPFVNRCEHNTS